jgi:hypothetical protein
MTPEEILAGLEADLRKAPQCQRHVLGEGHEPVECAGMASGSWRPACIPRSVLVCEPMRRAFAAAILAVADGVSDLECVHCSRPISICWKVREL